MAGLTGVALEVPGGIDLDLRVHDLLVHVGERLRDESVVGIAPAEMDPMSRDGIVFKVRFQYPVPHAGAIIETIEIPVGESSPHGFLAQHFRLHHHAVPIVSQGGIAEELPGKDMVPPQSGHRISPADAQFALVEALYGRFQSVVLGFLMPVIQVIHSVIHIEIQAVPVIEPMGDLGIQVVEEIVPVELDSFEDRRQEQGVHAPGADGIGCAPFPKRTLQVELVRVGLVIVLYLRVCDQGIQALLDVKLLVTIFDEAFAVFLQFCTHVFLLGRKLGFGHIHQQEVCCPGLDVLAGQGGAVFGRYAGRDVAFQLGAVQPVVSHAGHDFSPEKFRCAFVQMRDRLAGNRAQKSQQIYDMLRFNHPTKILIFLYSISRRTICISTART